MKLKIELPVYGHFTTNRNAERFAIGKELVEVDVPEYSNSDISRALTFTTGPVFDAGRDLHEYFAVGSDLIQNSGVALDGDGILNPKYYKSLSEEKNHPFVRGVFKNIYDETSDCEDCSKWGSKNVIPKDLACFLDSLYAFTEGPVGDFVYLQNMSDLPLKNVNSEIIDRQIDGFKEHMKSFIIVEGIVYQYVPEPVIDVYGAPTFNATVTLSKFGVDKRNTGNFTQKIANEILYSGLYFSFVDFGRIDEQLKKEYGERVSPEYKVGNVEVYRPDLLCTSFAALTSLKKSVELARKFMDVNKVNALVSNHYTSFQKKFRKLPIEELSLYQDLMNAIDNASPFEITPELDDCIAGIKNLYAPGVEKTSFGDRKLVDRVSEIIDDSVIDPVVEFSNSTVSL